jgi:hypothetical protein
MKTLYLSIALLLGSTNSAIADSNIIRYGSLTGEVTFGETEQNENDVDGWVPFAVFNDEPLVTDEEWLNLVSEMQVGIKAVNDVTKGTIFAPKEFLTSETLCGNIYDVPSLRETNNGRGDIHLYHEEARDCYATGLDYSFLTIKSRYDRLYYNHTVSYGYNTIDYTPIETEVKQPVTFYIK